MGCIQASAYTGDPSAILGTYSGVDALDQCNNFCGVCCIPACETDFANINNCISTPELITTSCGQCENYIDPNTESYYIDTNYKLICESGGVGGVNTGPWTAQTQYGYCPANHTGGCFEGQYDCSSENIKASGESIDYYTDPTNVASFISGGNPGSATNSDPCGGSYPCTKIKEIKKFSTIYIQKNPYGSTCFTEPCEVVAFDTKGSLGIWDDAYIGGCGGLFTNECFIQCPNGTGYDPIMAAEITSQGAYSNYIPACCSGVIDPVGTNKDKLWVFRIKGSIKKITIYNEGTHLSNQSADLNADYLCNSCNETPTETSGVYISEIHYAINRAHDLRVYLCDPSAGTMNDVSNYICNKNIPFFVPTLFDSIDWVNDEGYQYGTVNSFSSIVGTVWGMVPIGQSNGTSPLTNNSSCADRNPCNTDGFTRNSLNPNDYCPPCDPFNGIVGNMRQSDGTLYVVHTATEVSGSLTPIGIATPISVQFQPLPSVAGTVNINYVCDELIGQSGCANLVGTTWHSGQNCTSFDCNI